MRPSRLRPLSPVLGRALPIAALVSAALAIAVACGGRNGALATVDVTANGPDPGSGPYQCSDADPYDMRIIDDFEFGAATDWYTNNEICYPCTTARSECFEGGILQTSYDVYIGSIDASCSNTSLLGACLAQCLAIAQSPNYNEDPFPAALIPKGGRCGSKYGFNVLAGPFVNWGGSLGKRFASSSPSQLGIDASAYDGIAVWARSAPGYASAPRIIVSDPFTDGQYAMQVPAGQARFCDPNPPSSNASGGCDKFGTFLALTPNWQLFLLPFVEMRQGGWGVHRDGIDTSQLMSIEVDFDVGTWNFWVDDIAFYRQKAM